LHPREVLDVTISGDLCRRAFRHRRKGAHRRAMLVLRQAAHADEGDARIWTLYGAQCMRTGQLDSAARALTHAAWLRDREGAVAKARTTRAVLARIIGHRAA